MSKFLFKNLEYKPLSSRTSTRVLEPLDDDKNNSSVGGLPLLQFKLHDMDLSQIYSKASDVLILLGVEDEYTEFAHRAFQRGENDQGGISIWARQLIHTAYGQNLTDPLDPVWLDENPESVEEYHGLLNLLQQTWFERVWMIQEFALA